MNVDTRFTYAIFVTNEGKGYGCFAIRKEHGTNNYKVAGSFCNPIGKCNPAKDIFFSKEKARQSSMERLNSDWVLTIQNENNDYGEIIASYLSSCTLVPVWAKNAYNRKRVVHTLEMDNLNVAQLNKKIISDYVLAATATALSEIL